MTADSLTAGFETDDPALPDGARTRHVALIAHDKLIAHDNKKVELLEWASFNAGTLSRHRLYATGTTGTMLEQSWSRSVTS